MGAPIHTLELTNGPNTDDLKFHWEVNGEIFRNGEGQITDNVADDTKKYEFQGSIRRFKVIRGAGSASINGTSFRFQDLPGYDTRDGVPREDEPEPKPEPEPEESAVDEENARKLVEMIDDWDFDREPPHLLEFRSADGEPVDYRVSVSKELAPTSENGATHDPQDSVEQEGGDWTARGAVAGGLDAYRYGGQRLVFESDDPEKLEARVNEREWQSAAAYGCTQKSSDSGDSSGGSGGKSPHDRAEAAGLDINSVVTAESASDIALDDHTCYVVSGEIAGNIVGQDVTDVAIVGEDDARLAVGKDDRGYDVNIQGGSGFCWSAIDLDQRAHAAYGRIRASLDGGVTIEDTATIGSGGIPGQPGAPGGPALYIPALDSDGTNRMENVSLNYRGNFPKDHRGNLGAIGIWFGPGGHTGTLDIVNSEITGFPNNGVYTSAGGGEVNVYDSRVADNGVSQCGRINRGVIKNSVIEFDAERDSLENAWRPDHGVKGVGSEQKKAGDGEGVTRIENCEIRMVNVAKCGGGAATYTATTDNRIGVIEDCEFVMENCNGAPAIAASGGPVEVVRNCTFNQSRQEAIRGDVRTLENNEFGQ